MTELQEYLTARNIFTTCWGKQGKENMRDLDFYTRQAETNPPKVIVPKPQQLSSQQKYFQKKEQLENKVNKNPKKENLNICYICLVYFAKQPLIIKSHLAGKQHQRNWKVYQAKTFHKIGRNAETKPEKILNFPPKQNPISKEWPNGCKI